MDENKLSNLATDYESRVEWQVKATSDEVSMGDNIDLPMDLYEEEL
jgi:hypothetical protein